jgi:4-hydroxy-3-polyprenylbenzoate decarboxylase
VSVFVGGPPAMTVAAVMPLPEGLPELAFAGALGGRRVRLARSPIGCGVAAEADFVITGTVTGDRKKPEGPFGDHLGYYSLAHDFPVMEVEKVYARSDAIWPFTVVGRPPQEDTSFGALIHEITRPIIPTVIAGVKSVHAVDAAGVHPLLLALGSERYVPYERRRRPQELLTQSNAILGQGQLSLAKYLLIAAHEDDRSLDPHDEPAFFKHVLERLDPTRDLHFQTRTTVDTLDYSGTGFNEGSKLVIAAAGDKLRSLPAEPPTSINVPAGFGSVRRSTPGILIVGGPKWLDRATADRELETLAAALGSQSTAREYPLAVLVDDPDFVAADFNNFLWATFTRSDPATDVAGVDSFVEHKHWGCRGTIIIDARIKPKHAPPLVEDPAVSKRVDALAVANGPLHGLID